MRLIQNIYGEPPPLIMHQRLRLVRIVHIKMRFIIGALFGREPSLPRYWRSNKSPEQQKQVRDACREFIGGHSASPKIAHEHKMKSWEALLHSPTFPEELKNQMRDSHVSLEMSELAVDNILSQRHKTT